MNLDSAASVMIVALIDKRERHFLPTYTPVNEPIWWCYSQAPPTRRGVQAPIIPRPIPLPRNLEPGTLVWSSSWSSFDPEWTQFPGAGALRFVSITRETLGLWEPDLNSSRIGFLLDSAGPFSATAEQTVRTLAQSTLYKLAVGRLGVSAPSLSLLWEHRLIWPDEAVSSE
jgi:hypothetical protein